MAESTAPENVATFFTPVDNSAALVFLRRIIGCTFDKVWSSAAGGACNEQNDILAALIETFNWAMLAVIAGVATYLIYAALKDTANDGEVGGRSMNPSWTLVMAGIAAILCFPAFNGFSALQMATMKVAVWSTGLGDKMWSVASDKMATSSAVEKSFKGAFQADEDGWFSSASPKGLRQQVAKALYSRVSGQLCADSLSEAAKNLTVGGTVQAKTSGPTLDKEEGIASIKLYYDVPKSISESVGLCGGVDIGYPQPEANSSASRSGDSNIIPTNDAAQNQIEQQITNFIKVGSQAAAASISAGIQTQAAQLKSKLLPENGSSRGEESVKAIDAAVDKILVDAQKAMRDAVKPAYQQVMNATKGAMTDSQKNGWFYAVLYQRVLVNGTSGLVSVSKMEMKISASEATSDISGAFGCGAWFGAPSFCTNEFRTYFGNYLRQMGYLGELEGAFTAAGNHEPGLGANDVVVQGASGSGIGFQQMIADLFTKMAGANNDLGEGWADPIPQLQQTGNQMMTVGAGVVTVATGGSLLSAVAKGGWGVLGEFVSAIAPIGWFLVGMGFILGVVIPFMPLVYFFIAAFSWLLLAIQSILSAPLVLMQMFYPNRGGGIAGTSLARMLTVLLGLLLRPALIIIGLVLCMVAMRAGLDFLNVLTRNAFAVLSASGGFWSSATIGNLALALGGFFIYMSMAFVLVSTCCGLIDGVSDFVMNMVENGLGSMLSSEARHRSEGALGNPGGALAAGVALSGSRLSLAGTRSRLREVMLPPRDGSPRKPAGGGPPPLAGTSGSLPPPRRS